MYERIQGNDMYNGATNPPFGYSLGTSNVLLSDPHTTWTGGTVTVPIVPSGVVGINQNYPTPRASQYSLGVQRAIGDNAVMSVSYVGSVDRNESYWQEINLPPTSDLACLTAGNCPVGTAPFNGLVTYPGYTSIKQAFNGIDLPLQFPAGRTAGAYYSGPHLQAAYTLVSRH